MNFLLAMGIPNTTDDRGYFLWAAQNWPVFVIPALAFAALLVGWLIRTIRNWSTPTPGPSNPPSAQSETLEQPDRPDPPFGPTPQRWIAWPLDLAEEV